VDSFTAMIIFRFGFDLSLEYKKINPPTFKPVESYLISAYSFSGQCVTGPDVATLTATNEVG